RSTPKVGLEHQSISWRHVHQVVFWSGISALCRPPAASMKQSWRAGSWMLEGDRSSRFCQEKLEETRTAGTRSQIF
ncbi:MAG: hypothetical protein KDA89_03360, partial [Planctomycetaceae bacterium]|nr:hypothetical protein [Planctomycetaceae bacterium]